MHALIIEDEWLFAEILRDALEPLGYLTFDVADNEAATVAAASERCPDLIIADQRLAAGTGVSAVRTLCSQRPIPVIFFTSSAEEVLLVCPEAIVVGKTHDASQIRTAVEIAKSAPMQWAA